MNKRAAVVLGFWGFLIAVVSCGSNAEFAAPPPAATPDAAFDVSTGAGGGPPIIVPVDASQVDAMLPCHGDGACVPDNGPVCGDGVVQADETCDDGNAKPYDGCSALCRVEADFKCATAGQPCVSTAACGDGNVGAGEACDDGNVQAADGCSVSCAVEAGFACSPAGCVPIATSKCGDGAVNSGESCDDGNNADGDGCSAVCKREEGFRCSMLGQPCTKVETCGDGMLGPNEQCDDGGATPGDGCNGLCRLEEFFACKAPGVPCTSTVVCGDRRVDTRAGEGCDDGNTTSSDGCSSDCQAEPGFSCPTAASVGGSCVSTPEPRCGDSVPAYDEECDDGNATAGDGCSPICKEEPGYRCPRFGRCERTRICGDGVVSLGEACDDSNTVGGDGCSESCVLEPDFACPGAGQRCVSTVVCSDGIRTGNEQCDDRNNLSGDGCSAACQVEPGWVCPDNAVCRASRCGDGLRAGGESCDDGNNLSGDGCSAACGLEGAPNGQKDGWQCLVAGEPCTRAVCGNGTSEGSEQCDDGNNVPFDGCSWNCSKEPRCGYADAQYGCVAVCGDGMVFPGEACDDGNTQPGDGCPADCGKGSGAVESGWDCTAQRPPLADPLYMPTVYRDFQDNHPQFEIDPLVDRGLPGMVQADLDADGKPAYALSYVSPADANGAYGLRPGWTLNGAKPAANGPATLSTPAQIAAAFAKWYRSDATVNRTIQGLLTLTRTGNTFVYDNSSFFPLNSSGFGNQGRANNYHFTSETRYWFEYQGGERLDFRGDDDVWVFVNGKLAVDLGGIHGALNGSVALDGAAATVTSCSQATPTGGAGCATQASWLTRGQIYEIVVFQAERHVVASNYKLTLQGFNVPRSVCVPRCGDGKVVGNELCDLGVNGAGGTGEYGTCNPNCTLTPRCGDRVINGPEECDDGVNLTTYSPTRLCGPSCKFARFCGDSIVSNGEQCDDGPINGTGVYGGCRADCSFGPSCGDRQVTAPEQCDDGADNGTAKSLCGALCKLKCGDGVVDVAEQCDEGAGNVGGYGKCRPDCTWALRCGDGFKSSPPEECDDGKNDGSYGTCAPQCKLGPRCGDGAVQSSAGEECDLAAANVLEGYGSGRCLTTCRRAPFCGDRAVDAANGEMCDDGVNSGMTGSCKPDCSGWERLPFCGDGVLQPPEQCDDGARNGTVASSCDTRCAPKCGNGIKDEGEGCDDGVNDGRYQTCTSACSLAGYCGDGVVNGPEACDLGTRNAAAARGRDQCTLGCQVAPYCGDGRVQVELGEECDGSAGCTATCTAVVPVVH